MFHSYVSLLETINHWFLWYVSLMDHVTVITRGFAETGKDPMIISWHQMAVEGGLFSHMQNIQLLGGDWNMKLILVNHKYMVNIWKYMVNIWNFMTLHFWGKNNPTIQLIFYDFPYIGNFIIHSIIFQRGRAQPPSRLSLTGWVFFDGFPISYPLVN